MNRRMTRGIFLIVFLIVGLGGASVVQGQVILNEVMYHAAESPLEYVELFNDGDTPIDLSGWSLRDSLDSHRYIIPAGIHIPARGYLVLADDASLFLQTYGFSPHLSGITFDFSNSGDSVRLLDSQGRLVESLIYDDQLPWPESADGEGASLERRNPLLPAIYSAAWAASTGRGTPGERNSVYTDELSALIVDVEHSPSIPKPRETIAVRARILEIQSRVQSVNVYYSWNGSSPYRVMAMVDDGAHGDGVAGDGIYGAEIAGGSAGDVFSFYLQAINEDNRISLLPEEGEKLPYLTMVEDALAAERVPVLRVAMLPDVHKQFLARYQTDDYFPAALYEGDTAYYRVYIRHRGRSRVQNGRFKIRFSPDQLYRGKIRRLNFNGTDSSTILNEYLSYQLYQDAGLPNLESELVRFHLNGVPTKGTPYRVAIENPDGQFLRRRDYFNRDDGNLYKITLDGTPDNKATWRYVGEDPELYSHCYLKQTHEEEADYSDIIQFCRVLSEADPAEADFVEQVYSVLNPDDFLRWMAVSACVAHWDSPFTDHAHNYVLYNNPGTNQFHVLAWDLNGTFSYTSNTNDLNYRKLYTHIRSTKFPAINKILNHPVFGAQYYREIDRLLNTLFSPSAMNQRIEAARVALQLGSNSVNYLRTFVTQRNKDLALWINREQGAAFLTKPAYQTTVGEPYFYRAVAVDYANQQALRYRLDKGPEWLRIDSRTGVVQGVSVQEGIYPVVLRAESDSGLSLEQSFSLQVTATHPSLLMTFNEESGSALDLGSYNHTGKLQGGAARIEGRLGNAVYLNGSSGYVEIPHAESLSVSGAITVEAWIKPDSISNGNPVIVTKGDAENFNYTLMLGYGPYSWDAMEPCFMPKRFDIENRVYYGRKEIEAKLQSRRWVHIAGTYDSARELVCVYANNRRIVESANRALMPENTRSLLIGLGNNRGFRGAVDDIKILPFAKQAFAAGLCLSQVDVSGISSAQDRVSLSLSEYRSDSIDTGDYCLYLTRADRWISLPAHPLDPGKSVRWWLDELEEGDALIENETMALYPRVTLGRKNATWILDQVSWGSIAPDRKDEGVQAGVWLPGRVVSWEGSIPVTLALRHFADNDEFDLDWSASPQRLEGPSVSLTIENGEETIAKQDVIVHLHQASGNDSTSWKLRISNTPQLETDWISYQEAISWQLSEGDGQKTIYLQVVDAQGRRSSVERASVILQTQTGVGDWLRYGEDE